MALAKWLDLAQDGDGMHRLLEAVPASEAATAAATWREAGFDVRTRMDGKAAGIYGRAPITEPAAEG